jgi:hypothetical protein
MSTDTLEKNYREQLAKIATRDRTAEPHSGNTKAGP